MARGLGDSAKAVIAALILLGAAAVLVFVIHPGGSHGQVGWYAGLLPGSVVATFLMDFVQDLVPQAQRLAYLALTLVFSFLWYFLLAYIVIKVVRAAAGAKKA